MKPTSTFVLFAAARTDGEMTHDVGLLGTVGFAVQTQIGESINVATLHTALQGVQETSEH